MSPLLRFLLGFKSVRVLFDKVQAQIEAKILGPIVIA